METLVDGLRISIHLLGALNIDFDFTVVMGMKTENIRVSQLIVDEHSKH